MANEKILEVKKEAVAQLMEKINNAGSMILADYRGLTVEEDTELRVALREVGIDYKVVKNNYLRHAVQGTEIEELKNILVGPTAIALSDDEILPSKVLTKFAKQFEALEIKGGVVSGKIVALDEINSLAALPSKNELIAKMLGSLNAPISGFVNVLNGNMRGLVVALNGIVEKKQQESA